MSSNLEQVVNKTRLRLIPFMLMLYILAFLDRANIGFAKASYQLDTGLGDGAFALGAGIFFVAYAFLGVPANLLMRKFGARAWIGGTTLVWGVLSASMGYADSEWKFLLVRSLLGAAEAGFFPGMIYLTSQWFPQRSRAGIMGLFYMGAPLALTLGSPLSGALLEMHGFLGHPGWYWMFVIEGALALIAGFATFLYLDNSPAEARFLVLEERELLAETLKAEESTKATSKISDAVKRWPVWHLAIIYMIIQISVYGLVFYLPTQVGALMGTTVGFKVSLVAAIPWVAALFGTYYIPRYSDRTGERRITAAMTLLVAGLGLGVSAFASPGVAIVALCFAAAGFIAVQPVFWTMPTSLLSGAALAAGIGFTNMFGAFGGFLAPNIKAQADIFFGNHMAGLVTLAIITVCGSAAILALRSKKAPQPVPSEG
ncbi:MFS transporter [Desulfovibrio caledoniensis]